MLALTQLLGFRKETYMHFSNWTVAGLSFGVSLLAAGAALAGDAAKPATPAAPFRLLDEVQFGVNDHDFPGAESRTYAIAGEALSSRIADYPGSTFQWLVPRANIGATWASRHKTSYVFGGAAWTIPITDKIYVEGDFDVGAHDGVTDDANRANLGNCHWTFREAGKLGYVLDDHWSVQGVVEHLSQAGLCTGFNSGLTNLGVRAAYKF